MRPRSAAVSAVLSAALAFGPHGTGAQQPATVPAAVPPSDAPAAVGAVGAVHGVVYGVVYDSLTHHPLLGATVQIARADDLTGARAVGVDSAGGFRIDALAPGRYVIGFYHPVLDLLRVDATPRVVAIGSGADVVRVDLGVPDLARVRPVVCGTLQPPTDSTGLIAGRVRDAADGAPVANATVVLTWSELVIGAGTPRTERRRVPVVTGPGGSYVVCGVPASEEIVVTAAGPQRASGEVVIAMAPRGFVVRDLALGDTATAAAAAPTPAASAVAPPRGRDTATAPVARGTARLTGIVRDPAGHPVRGARAFVWGTAAATTASEDGAFALGGLPAGTRTLEVRAVGYAPRRVAVDLAAGQAGVADVRLDRVATLNPVAVFGTPSRPSLRIAEFLERERHNAFGRFLTAADFERRTEVSDALRGVAGMQIVSDGRSGNVILGRGRGEGACRADVILDGMQLRPGDVLDQWVAPRQVTGMEVYADAAFAPLQYGGGQRSGCSVVLVWTGR